MRQAALAAAASLACVLGTAGAAELVLVEKGVCRTPIILPENAPPATVQAANDLQLEGSQVPGDEEPLRGVHDSLVIDENDVLPVEAEAVVTVAGDRLRFEKPMAAPGRRLVVADGDGERAAPLKLRVAVGDPWSPT